MSQVRQNELLKNGFCFLPERYKKIKKKKKNEQDADLTKLSIKKPELVIIVLKRRDVVKDKYSK